PGAPQRRRQRRLRRARPHARQPARVRRRLRPAGRPTRQVPADLPGAHGPPDLGRRLDLGGVQAAGRGADGRERRRHVPVGGRAAVAVLVAASAATVDYGHWILSDPLFVLLTMTTLWLLERGARAGGSTPDPRLLAAGIAAALAAYFTRTAGLPLLIAVLGWLALERRWRTLGAAAAVLALPALLWALRGGGGGGGPGDYASEFWLVDPYRPALGTVGPLGLVGRAAGNAGAYLTRHGPATILGPEAGALAAPLGVLLAAAALTGWVLRL